jgi:hypothetical protein
MADKLKIVDGEVVETITGRLVKRTPAPMNVREVEKQSLPPEQQEALDRIVQHIDTSEIEQRLFETFAGGFVGLCYEEDERPVCLCTRQGDDTFMVHPACPIHKNDFKGTIILTDKD